MVEISKSCPTTCAVKTGDCVTQNLVQGAKAIFDYWVDFWDHLQSNQPPISDRTESRVGAEVQFEYISGLQLRAGAQTSSGGPSLDGWSASELKFLPLEVFNLVSSFFLHCLSVGEVPKQFLESRMICIPKTDKVVNYQINTADCRPITILSAFWRLWRSCMCQPRDVKNWLQHNLLPEVAGRTGEELYTTVIKIFDSFGSQNYILGMDYTKAFDVLDPQVTKALLKNMVGLMI